MDRLRMISKTTQVNYPRASVFILFSMTLVINAAFSETKKNRESAGELTAADVDLDSDLQEFVYSLGQLENRSQLVPLTKELQEKRDRLKADSNERPESAKEYDELHLKWAVTRVVSESVRDIFNVNYDKIKAALEKGESFEANGLIFSPQKDIKPSSDPSKSPSAELNPNQVLVNGTQSEEFMRHIGAKMPRNASGGGYRAQTLRQIAIQNLKSEGNEKPSDDEISARINTNLGYSLSLDKGERRPEAAKMDGLPNWWKEYGEPKDPDSKLGQLRFEAEILGDPKERKAAQQALDIRLKLARAAKDQKFTEDNACSVIQKVLTEKEREHSEVKDLCPELSVAEVKKEEGKDEAERKLAQAEVAKVDEVQKAKENQLWTVIQMLCMDLMNRQNQASPGAQPQFQELQNLLGGINGQITKILNEKHSSLILTDLRATNDLTDKYFEVDDGAVNQVVRNFIQQHGASDQMLQDELDRLASRFRAADNLRMSLGRMFPNGLSGEDFAKLTPQTQSDLLLAHNTEKLLRSAYLSFRNQLSQAQQNATSSVQIAPNGNRRGQMQRGPGGQPGSAVGVPQGPSARRRRGSTAPGTGRSEVVPNGTLPQGQLSNPTPMPVPTPGGVPQPGNQNRTRLGQ